MEKIRYKIYVYDFVKQEGDVVYDTNDFKEAKTHAYIEGLQFCEDEQPMFFEDEKDEIWTFRTNSDFGSLILKYEGE